MNNNINKIIYGTSTLIDLTQDTVDPDRMYKGDTAHAADGSIITGTAEITVDGTTLIMPEGLCSLLGTVDPETHKWVRPDSLPNLDEIYNGELNTIYMTVDATGRISDPHVNIKVWTNNNSTPWTVEVGHIENGEFISDSSESLTSATIWTKTWEPTNNLYPIIKISSNHILTLQWLSWTSSNGNNYSAQYQPVIEWIGHIEAITNTIRTPCFTEREKINVSTASADSLNNRWDYAFNLCELDVSDWNTSTWNITQLAYTWRQCVALSILDLSNWDVSNWKITSLSNTWMNCYSLEELNTKNWDTSEWTVSSLYQTWSNCYRLKNLELNHWDTSNWTVGSLYQTWYYCYSLEILNISNWDTSNWTVTNARYTWNGCGVLKYLYLNNWNTSKWAITGVYFSSTWGSCNLLRKLEISNWDTSKWSLTEASGIWAYCYSLQELKLNNWDTSNWNLTNISNLWYNCYSLQTLEIENWNTSNWAVTIMNNTWCGCKELEELDLSQWNTKNWEVTDMTSTWNGCTKLKKLHIKNWDTSNWAVTSISSTWANCVNLEYLESENWDTSNWTVTNMTSTFNGLYSLKSLNLSHWNTSNWPLNANTTIFGQTFRYLYNITFLDLSMFDFSKITNWKTSSSSVYNFQNNYLLTNIVLGSNNNNKMTYVNYGPIRFAECNLLTRESILRIFDALATGVSGKTLQLGSTNLNKLTAEEKAIATNKGWTLT